MSLEGRFVGVDGDKLVNDPDKTTLRNLNNGQRIFIPAGLAELQRKESKTKNEWRGKIGGRVLRTIVRL